MSSLRGPTIAGKRRAQHGDDLGGVVDRQRGLGEEGEPLGIGGRDRRGVGGRLDQGHAPSGTWPNVPITSGWPAWPTNRMCRPCSISRSAWRWTLETSGQVASR